MGTWRAPKPRSSGLPDVGGSGAKRSSPAGVPASRGSGGRGGRGGGGSGGGGSGSSATGGGVASQPRRSHGPRSQPIAEQSCGVPPRSFFTSGGGAAYVHASPRS